MKKPTIAYVGHRHEDTASEAIYKSLIDCNFEAYKEPVEGLARRAYVAVSSPYKGNVSAYCELLGITNGSEINFVHQFLQPDTSGVFPTESGGGFSLTDGLAFRNTLGVIDKPLYIIGDGAMAHAIKRYYPAHVIPARSLVNKDGSFAINYISINNEREVFDVRGKIINGIFINASRYDDMPCTHRLNYSSEGDPLTSDEFGHVMVRDVCRLNAIAWGLLKSHEKQK